MSRVTLSRYLIEQTRSNNTPADLRFLIEVVARACKAISHQVSKGALGGVLGSAGSENVQGEVQKKLDVISNEILLEANEWGGHLAGMASEEMDNAYQIPGKYPKGAYLLVFDPLDGSSNIDVNVSVGTIFSVLRCPERNGETGDLGEEAFLQPGTQQVAAIMHTSRDLTDSGVELARRAGASLGSITRTVSNIQAMNQQIAAAAEEQSAVAEEISRSVVNVRDVSEQTAAASEETAASSTELARLGGQLQMMVSRFRL